MQADNFSLRNLTALLFLAANTSVGVVKSGKISLSFSRQEKQKEKQALKQIIVTKQETVENLQKYAISNS